MAKMYLSMMLMCYYHFNNCLIANIYLLIFELLVACENFDMT